MIYTTEIKHINLSWTSILNNNLALYLPDINSVPKHIFENVELCPLNIQAQEVDPVREAAIKVIFLSGPAIKALKPLELSGHWIFFFFIKIFEFQKVLVS